MLGIVILNPQAEGSDAAFFTYRSFCLLFDVCHLELFCKLPVDCWGGGKEEEKGKGKGKGKGGIFGSRFEILFHPQRRA